MKLVYEVFVGDKQVSDLVEYANKPQVIDRMQVKSNSDQFYSNLYLALYYESKGDAASSKEYIQRAVGSEYGQTSSDYMAKLAKVHMLNRT